jgi:hypothetical protein
MDVCHHTLPAIWRPTSSAASTSSACLPHLHPFHCHRSCASAIVIIVIVILIVIVIVIVHPLFKLNFYFSLLCDFLIPSFSLNHFLFLF